MITDEEYRRILLEGIRLFNEHRFFECHDKLEEAWKEVKQEKKKEPASDHRRDFTHGLILLAVAFHHWQKGNHVGAIRKYDEAARLLAKYPGAFEAVDVDMLSRKARDAFEPYRTDAKVRFDARKVPRIPLRSNNAGKRT